MASLLNGAIPLLETAMRLRIARQAVLAGNVVNADTPGFRRQDLEFDGLLREASGRLEQTHPAHLGSRGPAGARLVTGPRGTRPDGNGVDLERELILLRRNAGAFQDQAAVLSRLYTLRRIAATSDGR